MRVSPFLAAMTKRGVRNRDTWTGRAWPKGSADLLGGIVLERMLVAGATGT